MSKIIILTGKAGSGKTTEAKEMAKNYKLPFFWGGFLGANRMPKQCDVVIIDSLTKEDLIRQLAHIQDMSSKRDYILICKELPFEIIHK